jgi:hypothetical protein
MNRKRKRKNNRNRRDVRCFNMPWNCTCSSVEYMHTSDPVRDILKACGIVKQKLYINEWPILLCTQDWFDKNKDNWKQEQDQDAIVSAWNYGIEIRIVNKLLLGDSEFRLVPNWRSTGCFMPVIINDEIEGISMSYPDVITPD